MASVALYSMFQMRQNKWFPNPRNHQLAGNHLVVGVVPVVPPVPDRFPGTGNQSPRTTISGGSAGSPFSPPKGGEGDREPHDRCVAIVG